MPRSARLNMPGTLHHVIARGIEKRQIVNNDQDRQQFVERLDTLALETKTPIYGWALMTNHVHILLHSGPQGLSHFMRRLLTSYAIYYNKTHQRHGHLFQNRYKSIVCEEDVYLYELVRYIHLNPLRANMVKTMGALDRYRWCGHSVLMGRYTLACQERDYILGYFAKREHTARKRYREFVLAGVSQGMRTDLTGGGLIRSLGGWSEVVSHRREKQRVEYDERILGSGEFVKRILDEADQRWSKLHQLQKDSSKPQALIEKVCHKRKVSMKELQQGGRRAELPEIRQEIVIKLVDELGLSLAETGRLVGISTSGVSRILSKST